MFRKPAVLLLLQLLWNHALLPAGDSETPAGSPEIVKGILDLRDLTLVGPLPLQGEWEFKLGTLATEFKDGSMLQKVPENWNFPGLERGRFGAGTYRLRILLHPSQPGLALSMPVIGNSYRVYWNEKLVGEAGVPALSRELYTPGWHPTVLLLEGLKEENELIIQTANFDDISSGLSEIPVLGPSGLLFQKRLHGIFFDVLIFGALLLMAFYHFGLYLYRKKDRSPLHFGLLALVLGLRPLLYGGMVFLEMWPDAPYQIYYRLGYLTFALAVTTFVSFLHSLYPSRVLKFITRVTAAVAGSYSLLILISPLQFFTSLLTPFQLFTLAAGLSSLFFILKALFQRKEGSGLFILGFLVFFAGTITDIVLSFLQLPPLQVVSMGLLFFMLFQSLIIAEKFSKAFAASEEYSLHLASLNNSLERFIPKEVLSFLRKKSIVDIVIGDNSEAEMTVMFVDIRDFTSLSETMSPKENFRFINGYLKRVGPVIRNNRGFVDKYMGDGIMALFPEKPEDAVRAALGIRQELINYNQGREKAGYPTVRIGMGIHSGKLMLGTIGENLRMDSTVISDTVNVAARLETLTKKLQKDVLISSTTVEKLCGTHGFSLRHCGSELIKGKSTPIEVFELTGELQSSAAPEPGTCPEFA